MTNQVGMAVSPVLAGNVLLLAMENAGDSFAAGLDKKTGKNLWKVKRPRADQLGDAASVRLRRSAGCACS